MSRILTAGRWTPLTWVKERAGFYTCALHGWRVERDKDGRSWLIYRLGRHVGTASSLGEALDWSSLAQSWVEKLRL